MRGFSPINFDIGSEGLYLFRGIQQTRVNFKLHLKIKNHLKMQHTILRYEILILRYEILS